MDVDFLACEFNLSNRNTVIIIIMYNWDELLLFRAAFLESQRKTIAVMSIPDLEKDLLQSNTGRNVFSAICKPCVP